MQADPAFTIRPATADDIPSLMRLIELSVRGLQQNDYSPSQIDSSIGSAFGVDRQLIADQTYFVATPANAPATFVASGGWSFRRTLCGSDTMAVTHGHTERDASELDPADPTAFAKIRAIFVHPAWSRQGLGSLILAHCEAAARAAGFTRLEMGSTLTGYPLYALKGYIERTRSSVPLPNGEALTIIHMDKTLL